MRRNYELKNGKVISAWYNDFGYLTIYDNNGNEETVLEFNAGTDNPVVCYNGEEIHVNDFMFTPLNEMIKDLAEDSEERISDDEILATIMKESERVGFVMDVQCFVTLMPKIGIGLKGSGSSVMKVLMEPFEDDFTIDEWSYKIHLRPVSKETKEVVGTERKYFSSICSMLRNKSILLVDKEEYRKEHPEDEVVERNCGVSILE